MCTLIQITLSCLTVKQSKTGLVGMHTSPPHKMKHSTHRSELLLEPITYIISTIMKFWLTGACQRHTTTIYQSLIKVISINHTQTHKTRSHKNRPASPRLRNMENRPTFQFDTHIRMHGDTHFLDHAY